MRQVPKVALIADTSYRVHRDLLLGIARYVRHNVPWHLQIVSGDDSQVASKLMRLEVHGIIGRMQGDRTARAVQEARLPTIALCLSEEQHQPDHPLSSFSEVAFDAADRVADLAFRHFRDQQLHNFAYVGLRDFYWSLLRERAFSNLTMKLGHKCYIFHQSPAPHEKIWEQEQSSLVEWICRLPKPVGILACNDERGRQVLDACQFADVAIPEDVAVLGVDNDETFCEMTDPPLPSIALNAETTGYSIARLLDGMINRTIQARQAVRVKAVGIITRRSTDILSLDDKDVSEALHYIRRQQGRGISVSDVAAEVALSRRSLETRFRTTIGRTVFDEIRRARLEHAKQILLETVHPVSTVAMMAGFDSVSHFIAQFRQHVGMTPGKFRDAARP